MTDTPPGHDADLSQAHPLTPPEDAAGGPAIQKERVAGAAAFWPDVKRHFEPAVTQAGLGGIPEPDSAEFPHFLATLHARNGPLALALVAATRRLRQGVDMPSSRAAQRRERNRATRRLLFMRRTPDGRWVADKRKAPVYGMMGLLLSGALLTAVYALPRLAAAPVVASSAQTSPVASEKSTKTVWATPTAESEAALKRSREDLARFRTQQAAREPQPAAPVSRLSGQTTRTDREPGAITGGLVGGAARSTTTFKPLGTEANPPPPPVVQERSVQMADRPPPAIYTPVSVAPAPQPPTPPAPSAPAWAALGAPPDPRPISPAPIPARPAPATSAQPVPAVRPSPPTPAAARPAPPASGGARVRASEAPDVSAAFGGLPVMPPPGDAPEAAASSPSTGVSGAPSLSADSALSPSTVQDTTSVPAPPLPDTAGFSSGVVYERAPRTGVASAAVSSGAGGTLAAETPFGSDASTPASSIGATGPFGPLEQIPATLMTAIRTPGGGSVPVVAVTPDGGSFVGLATINATLARVDMQFRRFVAADGTISAIDALAYSRDPGGLTQGLAAEIQVVAPTLALDAAQNSANALNTYVQNAASAAVKNQGTSINIGDNLTLSGSSVATLAQTLLGGLGSTFRMPENAQSITRIATIRGNVPLIVIAGLGGEGR